MSDQSRQKATVYVGGLDNQVNQQTLHDAFIPFGEIVDVSLPKPELYDTCLIVDLMKVHASETRGLTYLTELHQPTHTEVLAM